MNELTEMNMNVLYHLYLKIQTKVGLDVLMRINVLVLSGQTGKYLVKKMVAGISKHWKEKPLDDHKRG